MTGICHLPLGLRIHGCLRKDGVDATQYCLWASLVAQKVSVCLQCRRPGFDPQVGKIPWRRKWQPTLVFLPGEFHGQRSLAGYSPWGCKELDTTEWLTQLGQWFFNRRIVLSRKAFEYVSHFFYWSFPGGSDGKESTCNAEDVGLTPGLRRSPGEGNSYPLQYSYLENFMDRGT